MVWSGGATVRQMNKGKKKSNFHARFHHPVDSDTVDVSCDAADADFDDAKYTDEIVRQDRSAVSFYIRSSKTILMNRVDSNQIEEEIRNEDGEFLKGILEQKVITAFTLAGMKKKTFV